MAADAAAAPAKPGKIATVIQLSIQSIFLSIVYIVFVYAVRLWKGELVNFPRCPPSLTAIKTAGHWFVRRWLVPAPGGSDANVGPVPWRRWLVLVVY